MSKPFVCSVFQKPKGNRESPGMCFDCQCVSLDFWFLLNSVISKAQGWLTLHDFNGISLQEGEGLSRLNLSTCRGWCSEPHRNQSLWCSRGREMGSEPKAYPEMGQRNQPLKKASLVGHEVRLEGEFSCRGLCWERWFPSDFSFSISCVSRHWNELTGPKFLSQGVLILGLRMPIPSPWVTYLDIPCSMLLRLKATGQREISRRCLRSFPGWRLWAF